VQPDEFVGLTGIYHKHRHPFLAGPTKDMHRQFESWLRDTYPKDQHDAVKHAWNPFFVQFNLVRKRVGMGSESKQGLMGDRSAGGALVKLLAALGILCMSMGVVRG